MRRNKLDTREELRRAMLRIERGRPRRINPERSRMSISAVAREAGISAASIHNTYPDIAEAIRSRVGKGARSALDTGRREKRRLEEHVRGLRERLKTAEQEIVRIASENARLVTENSLLKARLGSRKVISLRAQPQSAESASEA